MRRDEAPLNEESEDPNADLEFESEQDSIPPPPPKPFWLKCRNIVDSYRTGIVGVVILTIDTMFFLFWLSLLLSTQSSPSFLISYNVMDWITAIYFASEVLLRVIGYGFWVYTKNTIHMFDLIIATANLGATFISQIANLPSWLQMVRFMRLLRMITLLAMMREQSLKGRAQKEVAELQELLEAERSNMNKLTKWKIASDDIAVGDTAGEGGFGAVHLGLFRGSLVAVKQLFNSESEAQLKAIEEEAVALVNLRHPNVVLFMGFVHEPDRLWIVTEYCSRGSVRDILDDEQMQLSHSRILKFALGAARGLAYLHGQDPCVLHLDLKTSNILISSGWDTKLADFGLSRTADSAQEGNFTGTTQYCAPEILASNIFGTAADVYALGICLWEMAAREVPFFNKQEGDIVFGVTQSHMRPDMNRIRAAEPVPKPVRTLEPSADLDVDKIEVKDASALTVLRSIKSTHSETKPPVEILSPVTPSRERESTWEGRNCLSNTSSSGGSYSISDQVERMRRQSAPVYATRNLSGRPALAASATQMLTQDHSGNSYSAGDVAEASGIVDEQAGLNNTDSFALVIDRIDNAPSANPLERAIGGATPDERYAYMMARKKMDKERRRREVKDRQLSIASRRAEKSGGYGGGERHGAVGMSFEYCELVKLCWAHDPSNRPSADEVVWRLVGMIDNDLRGNDQRG